MLPVMLARTSHHEEISVAEFVADRRAAVARPEPERAASSDADDGDVRFRETRAAQVAVPGDGVVSVAVPVEPDRVELHAVVRAQRSARRAEHRERLPAGRAAPPRRQSRFGEAPVVHRDDALMPLEGLDERVERVVRAAQPRRRRSRPSSARRAGAAGGRRTSRRHRPPCHRTRSPGTRVRE